MELVDDINVIANYCNEYGFNSNTPCNKSTCILCNSTLHQFHIAIHTQNEDRAIELFNNSAILPYINDELLDENIVEHIKYYHTGKTEFIPPSFGEYKYFCNAINLNLRKLVTCMFLKYKSIEYEEDKHPMYSIVSSVLINYRGRTLKKVLNFSKVFDLDYTNVFFNYIMYKIELFNLDFKTFYILFKHIKSLIHYYNKKNKMNLYIEINKFVRELFHEFIKNIHKRIENEDDDDNDEPYYDIKPLCISALTLIKCFPPLVNDTHYIQLAKIPRHNNITFEPYYYYNHYIRSIIYSISSYSSSYVEIFDMFNGILFTLMKDVFLILHKEKVFELNSYIYFKEYLTVLNTEYDNYVNNELEKQKSQTNDCPIKIPRINNKMICFGIQGITDNILSYLDYSTPYLELPSFLTGSRKIVYPMNDDLHKFMYSNYKNRDNKCYSSLEIDF